MSVSMLFLALLAGCTVRAHAASSGAAAGARSPSLLEPVADVHLPGRATRFDYEEVDAANGHLVIAHMNDGEVDVVALSDGSTVARIAGVPRARGVAIGDRFIYVTSSPDHVVRIDRTTLKLVDRLTVGRAPDGIEYDPVDQVVGVSDQGDGAISLLAKGGDGPAREVRLGSTTGNVRYDAKRHRFWIAVEPMQLVGVDPLTGAVVATWKLEGCSGAHGVRLDPKGQTAFVACEDDAALVRVDLDSGHQWRGRTTSGPDVLAIDPGIGRLYVAAEAGATSIYDIDQEGVSLIGRQDVGANAHSVAADPSTHRVFFPLERGADGTPVLRIMKPAAR